MRVKMKRGPTWSNYTRREITRRLLPLLESSIWDKPRPRFLTVNALLSERHWRPQPHRQMQLKKNQNNTQEMDTDCGQLGKMQKFERKTRGANCSSSWPSSLRRRPGSPDFQLVCFGQKCFGGFQCSDILCPSVWEMRTPK